MKTWHKVVAFFSALVVVAGLAVSASTNVHSIKIRSDGAIVFQFRGGQAFVIGGIDLTDDTCDATKAACSAECSFTATNVEDFTNASDTSCKFQKLDEMVIVTVRGTADTADTTRHRLRFSLPIATSFTASSEAEGVFVLRDTDASVTSRSRGGTCQADSGSNEIECTVYPYGSDTTQVWTAVVQYIL